MAAITPTQLFTGYALLAATDPAPSQGIFIPLSSLTGLSASEAHPSTGNGSEVSRILTSTQVAAIAALAANARPVRFTAVQGSTAPVAGSPNVVSQAYTMTYQIGIDASSASVAAEPS